jgi:hypothetical protein
MVASKPVSKTIFNQLNPLSVSKDHMAFRKQNGIKNIVPTCLNANLLLT